MGDVNDGDALGLELADDGEQPGRIAGGQAARRLIQHEDAAAAGQGPRDLNELLRGDGELSHPPFRPQVRVFKMPQCTKRRGPDLAPVHPAEAAGFESEHDVLLDRELWRERELLIDHRDPGVAGGQRGRGPEGFAVEFECAGIGRMRP